MILYTAKITIYLCGLFNVIFGLFHIIRSPFIFDSLKSGNAEESKETLLSTLNISVAIFLFFLAFLDFYNPIQIFTTTLGKNIQIFGMIFWFIRLCLLLFWDYREIGRKMLFIVFLICGVVAHYYPLSLF